MKFNYIYNWFNIGTALKEQQNPSSVGCTVNNSIQCFTSPCHMHDINISLQEGITYKKINFPKKIINSFGIMLKQYLQKLSVPSAMFLHDNKFYIMWNTSFIRSGINNLWSLRILIVPLFKFSNRWGSVSYIIVAVKAFLKSSSKSSSFSVKFLHGSYVSGCLVSYYLNTIEACHHYDFKVNFCSIFNIKAQ